MPNLEINLCALDYNLELISSCFKLHVIFHILHVQVPTFSLYYGCSILQVHTLSSDCLEGSHRLNAEGKSEEDFRKLAAEEKEKHMKAVKHKSLCNT